MVQVAKEPIGTKGARVTNNVSIAGRHLVYMPTVEHVGVSRRIVDDDERTRLKNIFGDPSASRWWLCRENGSRGAERRRS